MRLIKVLGAAIVAVLALSAMVATGASAHEFEANKETGLISVKGNGSQVFTTPAGVLTCTSIIGHGIVIKAKVLTQAVTVSYSGCTSSIPATTVTQPITASYLFSADNGEVEVTKPVLILVTQSSLRCHTVVSVQKLTGITYDNLANKKQIEVLANVPSISTTGTGSLCTYTTSKTGKYVGKSITEVVGGELKWV